MTTDDGFRRFGPRTRTGGARRGHAVVTGGAGFIGTNLADRLLREGRDVLLLDDLSRPLVGRNVAWLRERWGDRAQFVRGDVRDARTVTRALEGADQVFHLAAQVAVTTSLVDPVRDFQVNAFGTLNVLEAARAMRRPPAIVFTSTNKVYGALHDVELAARERRCEPRDPELRAHGVSEARPVDFHSPYGCSKGAADQYVLDYARTFGLPAVVFRMSCIYGPRQFGNEDQGWVAHLILQTLRERPVTVFGDGRQVRDLLYVGDLVDAFLLAQERIDAVSGRAFNMGGGPPNTLSVLELLDRAQDICAVKADLSFDDWRVGDQRYYVSDTRRFRASTGWRPAVPLEEGLDRLAAWLSQEVAGTPAAV